MKLNDLFDYGYKIYQNDDYFKFSIDSVLLAEFVDLKMNQKNILDLCSGNAPIPMILSQKYGDKVFITAIELQKEIYEMGLQSIQYNHIYNINYILSDILNYSTQMKYDVITCNPPYFKFDEQKVLNQNIIKAIARHEIKINLEQIIQTASKFIKNQGYFYLVHRAERIAEIIYLLNNYHFGVKKIQPIYNDENSKCCFVLIEALYNGKNYVIINSPVFLSQYETYQNIFKKNNEL